MTERCEADDPLRCLAITKIGQCPVKAMPGVKYCSMHGGVQQTRLVEEKNISNYNLAKWNVKLKGMRDSPAIKSLRDEAGILRMSLEAIINKCEDEQDLILHSGRISDMVAKIEKLVTSCHKLEESLGHTLDKQSIMQFADGVVSIISKELPPERLGEVADQIFALLEKKDETHS